MDDLSKMPASRQTAERMGAEPTLSVQALSASPAAQITEPCRRHPARSDPDAPFDVEELLRRCLGDAEFLGTILGMFDNRAGAMLRELEAALADDNARNVARAAHGIKGAAANLSADALMEAARELEDLGNAGCVGEARLYQDVLRRRMAECIDYIPRATSAAAAAAKMEAIERCES